MGRTTRDSRYTNVVSHEQTNSEQQSEARVVHLCGDVDEQTIAAASQQLVQLDALSHKPIHLVISTYGGVVYEMFGLYDTMNFVRSPVYTVGIGKIMSAGVLLLSAGVKGKRLIGQNATVMMHGLSGGTYGLVYEMENEIAESRRLQDNMINFLAKNTKMTKEFIEDCMKTKSDIYITAERAIKLGIADKMIGQSVQ